MPLAIGGSAQLPNHPSCNSLWCCCQKLSHRSRTDLWWDLQRDHRLLFPQACHSFGLWLVQELSGVSVQNVQWTSTSSIFFCNFRDGRWLIFCCFCFQGCYKIHPRAISMFRVCGFRAHVDILYRPFFRKTKTQNGKKGKKSKKSKEAK